MGEKSSLNLHASKQLSPGDLKFTPPNFKAETLIQLLQQEYGITGQLKRLAGERDQNFQVIANDGTQYVLKVSSSDEGSSSVDFQIQTLLHIQNAAPNLPIPRLIFTHNGLLTTNITDRNSRSSAVRLLSFVPGVPLSSTTPPSLEIFESIGQLMGNLCQVLATFDHPAATLFMPWDIMNGLVVSDDLMLNYLPPELLKASQPTLERLCEDTLPRMHKFEAQIIHNDAHEGNVMYEPTSGQISGLIDFGDSVKRPLVVDISTLISSFYERQDNLLAISEMLLKCFTQYTVFPDNQREVLLDAILARLLLTVQLMNYRIVHNLKGADSLRDIGLPQATTALACALDIDRDSFTQAMRKL